MNYKNRDKKAIELANDTTKRILTLSTGIVFLSIAFKKDFVPEGSNGTLAIRVLIFAWFLYLCSILAGVLTLLFLTGEVGRKDGTMPSIYDAKFVTIISVNYRRFSQRLY